MRDLLADRFLVGDRRPATDLATGDTAFVRIERSEEGLAQQAWAERCAALTMVWHPWLAECLDFGLVGDARRFEAYRLVPGAAPGARRARTLRAEVRAFLAACDLDPGGLVSEEGPSAVLVLPGPAGSASAEPAEAQTWMPGLRLAWRPCLSALVERLEQLFAPGAHWCDVEARCGTGGRTLLRQAGREGRRRGWVPIAMHVLEHGLGDDGPDGDGLRTLLGDRHLLVLHDARGESPADAARAASAVTRAALATRRACLVCRLLEGVRSSGAVRLAALSDSDLREALVAPAERAGRIAAAVRRASGRPRVAWESVAGIGRVQEPHLRLVARAEHVREARATFGANASARPAGVVRVGSGAVDVARAADGLVARGRHRAAERALRQGASARARRGDTDGAATLTLATARLVAGRGRIVSAMDLAQQTVELSDRGGDLAGVIDASIIVGECALLALDADRAASALRAAAAAARTAGDASRRRMAAAALARGLWWLGRFDEARAWSIPPALPHADAPGEDDADVVVAERAVAARLALADGRIDDAACHGRAATQAAARGSSAAQCTAALARARWLATAGDVDALVAAVRDGLAGARRAHRPLDAARFRLLAAEGALRARAQVLAQAWGGRLRHLAGTVAPPLLSARARLALGVLASAPDVERLREGLVRRGFAAFAHPMAGALATPPVFTHKGSPMLDDLMEMLRVCQDEEPRAALSRVAELVRLRCSAAIVAVLTSGTPPVTITVPPSPRGVVVAARRALDGGIPIDLHSSSSGLEAAVPMRCGGSLVGALGCRWVIDLPSDPGHVRRLLEAAAAAAGPCARALHEAAAPAPVALAACELLGTSASMESVRRAIAQAADAPFPVLIEGESGSGKELAARAIHRAGPRRARPFCAVNGAAVPDDLLESELFGHARGAFTGAIVERRGLFEEADGGVLFVDEVGELSVRAQAKLLRAVQEGEIRRIGETQVRRVDVRLVTATNRMLQAEVAAGSFRRDLYYRLAVIRIVLPPLRERAEDVPLLASALWERAIARVGSRATLSTSTLGALARYDWPGNVRELQNVLSALAVSAPRRGTIGPSSLPAIIAGVASTYAAETLEAARRHFETRFVRAALARAGWHRGRAAADLGLSRQGLAKLLARLDLEGLVCPASGTASADGGGDAGGCVATERHGG